MIDIGDVSRASFMISFAAKVSPTISTYIPYGACLILGDMLVRARVLAGSV